MDETLNKNYIVEKSKALIWAKFSEYNLGEMRLIDTYLAKINARESNSSEVVFGLDEYLKLLGYLYPNKVKSKDIEESLDRLLGSRIKIDLNNSGDYIKVNLFSDARVIVSNPDFGRRTITIDCNPKLKEAFFGLAEKGYVEYKLDYSLRLRSKYAIKLYPLLKDNLYKREWSVDLKELRELIGATNKNNESFREFNKVLQKCEEDINNVTDIEFSYEKITKGRLTRGIVFTIKKKTQKKENIVEMPGQESFDDPASWDAYIESCKEPENPMMSTYEFWMGACENEFTWQQIRELGVLAAPHIEFTMDKDEKDRMIYDYLRKKYISLANRKIDKSRYGMMKFIVEKDV